MDRYVKFLKIKTPETINDQIYNYVILKLISGEWPVWSKISSENRMAIMFNCSRLTIRKVFQEFETRGIFTTRKGSGYYVATGVEDFIILPIDKINGYNVQDKITSWEENDWLKREWLDNFRVDYNNTTWIERICYKEDEIKKYSIIVINNDVIKEQEIWEDTYMQSKGMIKYEEIFPISSDKIAFSKQLGWGEHAMISSSISHDNHDWTLMEFKIEPFQEFKIKKHIKYLI